MSHNIATRTPQTRTLDSRRVSNHRLDNRKTSIRKAQCHRVDRKRNRPAPTGGFPRSEAEVSYATSANFNGFARSHRSDRMRSLNAQKRGLARSEEHTSELQSLMRISYAVFCLKKKIKLAQT